jgi:hypothetical protein
VADEEAQTQLTTRIPKGLRLELRLHCVKTDSSVMDFVAQAINEKLKQDAGRRQRST